MKISQEFIVARPLATVWDFFKDAPEVATCLPGAEYGGSPSENLHTGRVKSKIGPFQTNFEGEATVLYDEAEKTVRVEGKGVDKKGASRSKMSMVCRLSPVSTGTNVSVDADIQLSGAIAQFGRTGLLNEVANVLVADFVRNAEAKLAAPAPTAHSNAMDAAADTAIIASTTPQAGSSLSLVGMVIRVAKSWIQSLLRSKPQS